MSTILSIDHGAKRIGLAIAEKQTKLALPYDTIENKNLKFAISQIKNIVQQEDVGQIIIGLPKSLTGQKSNNQELDKFVDKIKETINLPVELVDERLSSKAADKFKLKKDFKESGWRDKVAAAVILQDYIEVESP